MLVIAIEILLSSSCQILPRFLIIMLCVSSKALSVSRCLSGKLCSGDLAAANPVAGQLPTASARTVARCLGFI